MLYRPSEKNKIGPSTPWIQRKRLPLKIEQMSKNFDIHSKKIPHIRNYSGIIILIGNVFVSLVSPNEWRESVLRTGYETEIEN